jgi:uncharacterized protein (TIGR03435 family)
MKHLLWLAVLPGALLAQTIEGTWQGTLTPPNQNGEIRLAFKIDKNGSTYQGTFYNLANGHQQNLGAVSLQGNAVKIAIPGNGMNYEGRIEADGNSITGTLIQGTNPLPLPLKRASAETAWELPPPPAAPKPLPAGTKPEFEVASIKPSPLPPGLGLNVTATELRTRSMNLADLIAFTYELHPMQVAGLPGWAGTQGYEIIARLPQGGDPSDTQVRTMLKNLMKDRFGLSLHTEKRELSVYTIRIGKNGPAGIKMVKNTTNGARVGAQGLGRTVFSGVTMAGFASQLQLRVLDRPVIDQTGLTDRYDFTLNWRPDEFQFPRATAAQRAYAVTNGADALPDLFAAVQEQLGLKLDATKTPMDVLVIDSMEKTPTAN